jgi:IS30 family transposase
MEALIGANISADKIAIQLGRHRSTIYREMEA